MDDHDTAVPPASLPAARWPWQRSLQSRIVLTYGAVFILVLALLMLVIGRVVYEAQIAKEEQALEIEAFLAANTLQDPLGGYAAEFAALTHREEERQRPGSGSPDEASQAESDGHENGSPAGNTGSTPSDTSAQTAPSTQAAAPAQTAARLQQMADAYAGSTDARVTILDPTGNVVADSANPVTPLPSQFTQIEVQAALQGQEQHDVRANPDTGKATLYAAAPIKQSNRILGVVQLGRPVAAVTAAARSLMLSLVIAGLVALMVATALAIGLARQLVKPVRAMEEASVAIAGGDLSRRVPVETADELGALAGAFNSMVATLHRMIEQQRLFIANASHELRTPLTNIKLRSEALLGPAGNDPAVAHRYLAEIDREADRLGRLASTLLDLSSLDDAAAGPRALPDAADILPVLRSVAETIHMRAVQAGLDLTADLPAQLPLLRVRPHQVEAILVNLLDNAIKYTAAPGEVRLSVRVEAERCLIRVRDTGPGIPADDLPHIFERFYRADKARSRGTGVSGVGSGAGLGLSIVKSLVEQNGGSIRVESVVGQGTVFEVAFQANVSRGTRARMADTTS